MISALFDRREKAIRSAEYCGPYGTKMKQLLPHSSLVLVALIAMLALSGCAETSIDISGRGSYPIVPENVLAKVTSVKLVPLPPGSNRVASITVTDEGDVRNLVAAMNQSSRQLLQNDWMVWFGRYGISVELYANDEQIDSFAIFQARYKSKHETSDRPPELLPGPFLLSTENEMLAIPPDLAEAVYWCIEHARQRGEPVEAVALRFDAFTPNSDDEPNDK